MPEDQYVGSVTVLNISRVGAGSTTGFYAAKQIGLGRIKGGNFILKLMGSYEGIGSQAFATIYGGMSGSPVTDLMTYAAEIIGSMYLGTTINTAHVRVKNFSTSGALVGRITVKNAVIGTPIKQVKVIIGRTLEST